MRVEEIMSTPAICCRTNDGLDVAARLMWQADCGTIPVTDDTGRLAGIITDRDICMATYTRGKAPQEIRVSEVMASEVCSCHVDDSLKTVEWLLSEHQIRRAPVVDEENRPIGVVSLNNIARHAASLRKNDAMVREAVQTMAAVCRPRTAPSPP